MRKMSVFFIVIISILIMTGCGPKEEMPAMDGDTEKPANINAPIAQDEKEQTEYDASSNTTPEFFPWNCEDFSIQAGTNIGFYYEWMTKTEDQNADYFEAADHQVFVNNVPVNTVMEGVNGIEADGEGNYRQLYWIDIGNYPAGVYELRNIITINEQVFDGWDWYGPDSDYAVMESGCTVTVTNASSPAGESAGSEAEEAPAAPASACSISSPIRPDWATAVCDTFESDTVLWLGRSQGTTTRLESGEYIVDNSTSEAQGYTTGFTFPIFAGSAKNHMISVDGKLESKFKDCTWGVFVRSKSDEIVYFFMIDNQGWYTLTGSTENDAARYLGNIDSGSHSAIEWDGVNNLTAVADGRDLEFYINDELVATHEANNDYDSEFGLIVWGGEGVTAVTRFDNLLIKTK